MRIIFKRLIMVLPLISCLGAGQAVASEQELQEKIQRLEARVKQLENMIMSASGAIAPKTDVNTGQNNIKSAAQANESIADKAATNIIANSELQDKNAGGQVKVTMKPAPKFETRDGQYSMMINGYVQSDTAAITGTKGNVKDGSMIRNARLSFSGKLTEHWEYFFQTNFAHKGTTGRINFANVSYKAFDPLTLTFGKVTEPFSMEQIQHTRNLMFLERASLNILAPTNSIGLMASTYGNKWTAAAGVFGGDSSSLKDTQTMNNQRKAVTARLTYDPVNSNGNLIHLGISGSYRTPDNVNGVKGVAYQVRPETEISPILLSTGTIATKNSTLYGLEFGAAKGPVSIQSEYMGNKLRTISLGTARFKGGYVQIGWVLTGEAREYLKKQGIFGNVVPKKPFDLKAGNLGAWELAARYNFLNLNDNKHQIQGGKMRDIAFGLNWYPNEHIKFMGDYAIVNADLYRGAYALKDKPRIFMLRAQIGF